MIENSKKEIRKAILSKRKALSAEQRTLAKRALEEYILNDSMFKESKSILVYVSYSDELETTGLIEKALQMGKKVYVPKVLGKMYMEFYRIDSLAQLTEGYYGIPEPSGTESLFDGEEENSVLMIMPGVAYDQKGYRLGYGGGFYDVYLEKHRELQTRTIAVGFACQKVEKLPVEENDIRPKKVKLF